MSVNKVHLIGNLGADPELRYTQGGQAVANFNIACNEKWQDKDGKTNERVEWVKIVVWGRQAENCEKYLSKGRSVYVEGRLQTRDWEDKDGNTRKTTEVVAQSVQFLSGGSEQSGGNQPDPPADYDQSFNDDDIPFICAWAVLPFIELITTWGLL